MVIQKSQGIYKTITGTNSKVSKVIEIEVQYNQSQIYFYTLLVNNYKMKCLIFYQIASKHKQYIGKIFNDVLDLYPNKYGWMKLKKT